MSTKAKRPTVSEGWERNARIIVGDKIHAGEANASADLVRTLARGLVATLDDRAAKMKRPAGHTPAVQHVYDLVANNAGMYPAELWDKFGANPQLIGISESNFKKRAGEARTELRKSGKLKK
jgi:hypothetical protein